MAHLVVCHLTSFICCWLILHWQQCGCCVLFEKRRMESSDCSPWVMWTVTIITVWMMWHIHWFASVVVVVRVQWWLGAVEQWLPEMAVIGNDAVEGDGEDLVHQMRGNELGGDWVERVWSLNTSPKFSKFGHSICPVINTHACDNSSVAWTIIVMCMAQFIWRSKLWRCGARTITPATLCHAIMTCHTFVIFLMF